MVSATGFFSVLILNRFCFLIWNIRLYVIICIDVYSICRWKAFFRIACFSFLSLNLNSFRFLVRPLRPEETIEIYFYFIEISRKGVRVS